MNDENAEIEIDEITEIDDDSEVGYPDELLILPLNRRPFFPGMAIPVQIDPGPYYEALKAVSKADGKYLGLALTIREDQDILDVSPEDVHSVGTIARILRIIPADATTRAQVFLNIESRVHFQKKKKRAEGKEFKCFFLPFKIPAEKTKKHITLGTKDSLDDELKAYTSEIVSIVRKLSYTSHLFKEELELFLGHSDFISDPGKLADIVAALTTASRDELQSVLESFDLIERMSKVLDLLKKELDISKIQSQISKKIDTTVSKTQREFFLKEQLKAIKKELGMEKDEKICDIEKFQFRLEHKSVPVEAKKVIDEEIEKLKMLETHSPEYGVCRNYLDWLTSVPWSVMSEEKHELEVAEKVLEDEHYGLEDIKKRILEFIAVGKRSGGVKGSIICLVGPPGVGKTSIGKSIAHALERKFFRFSVGGMRDEAEIKGHRRTYIGAMPGKLIQALKQTEVMNPVIMIDEVDKMTSSYQGDPASALLEVLDPEQNCTFLDHYLDVRVDLSNILFIVTSNVLDTMPPALVDRMEILRLSGYITQEKVEIARKYLIPRNRDEMGLKASEVSFSKSALTHIINKYAREAGVRNLENQIKKILRKVAIHLVREEEKGAEKVKKITITESNLEEYLGKPIFTSDRIYKKTPRGVTAGLAWTSLGGAILYIEVSANPGEKTVMKLTGQAGDVMKESSQIAWTYAQTFAEKHKLNTFFEKQVVHLHIPEGATPKDGPSAGITMTTAILSQLTGKTVKNNLGMTGELSLTGIVLPIGGLKEKLIAARRSGLTEIICPEDNRRDYDELPDYLKEGVRVHFVKHYEEVYPIAFEKK